MTLKWAGLSPDTGIENLVRAALSHIDNADVVLTNDLQKHVREQPGYESFTPSRGSGKVGAKTLWIGSGLVVVDVPALMEIGSAKLKHVVLHESGHVLTFRRGETVHYEVEADSQAEAELRPLAVDVLDEFRAEKLAVDLSQSVEPDLEDIGHLLHVANCEVLIALSDLEADWRDLAMAIFPSFIRVSKELAVLAASSRTSAFLKDAPPQIERLWESMVGQAFDLLSESLSDVPSSAEKDENREQRVNAVINAIKRLLQEFGFRFGELGEGYGFIRIKDDHVFNERKDLAQEFVKIFGDGR